MEVFIVPTTEKPGFTNNHWNELSDISRIFYSSPENLLLLH